jgi:hypothetical protein
MMEVEKFSGKDLKDFRGIKISKLDEAPKYKPIEIAVLDEKKFGPGVQVLAREPASVDDPESRPVIVQASCGLGRVILLAFDIDKPPFTTWVDSPQFWKTLAATLEPVPAKSSNANTPVAPGSFNATQQFSGELATRMYNKLDTFDEVPVVSFGWVALFILVYIVVVGPLDYVILNKVIKRPELTWITFPAVVILISVAAYFTAYWLKGNDLRINKFDLVDIIAELPPGAEESKSTAIHGSTWFTIFSPRIQNYTVSVLPPENDSWVPSRPKPSKPNEMLRDYSTVVTWFGRPDDSSMGFGGGVSLYRRTYDYAPDAVGLDGVPIQVWTTKGFQASWKTDLTDQTRPLIVARLKNPGDKDGDTRLSGRIDSNLPVGLDDAVLIYRRRVYKLGRIDPGTTLLDPLLNRNETTSMATWTNDVAAALSQAVVQGKGSTQPSWSALVKPLMFNDAVDGNPIRNSLLRSFDQTWQVDRPETAVLVGRAIPRGSPEQLTTAEAVTEDPVSVSQLWLGELPSQGGKRPTLNGKMTQETYVRIFLPVKKP